MVVHNNIKERDRLQILAWTISIERNILGSDHRKSECGGEMGCVNKAVDMAIPGRKVVVSNADYMYTWCSTNLCLDEFDSKRRFFGGEKYYY